METIMENSKYTTIKEITEYGLENIPDKQTITINLKNFMYIRRVLEEYMRYFHNPDHYKKIEDVKNFLGDFSSGGALEVLDIAVYKIMNRKINFPKNILEMDENEIFDNPLFPEYYSVEE
jgi:hypothetical protein